ncbi:hypothetical protein J6590_002123 [Homalodisca vitripennis]|nr:hypothetical protein J6590_002123 [Homalodisca vitripennis]
MNTDICRTATEELSPQRRFLTREEPTGTDARQTIECEFAPYRAQPVNLTHRGAPCLLSQSLAFRAYPRVDLTAMCSSADGRATVIVRALKHRHDRPELSQRYVSCSNKTRFVKPKSSRALLYVAARSCVCSARAGRTTLCLGPPTFCHCRCGRVHQLQVQMQEEYAKSGIVSHAPSHIN